jgi:hypothetical protein
MRALATVLVLWLAACQEVAHIDLRLRPSFDGQCEKSSVGNPSPPRSCDELTLDCATHLQTRVRKYQNGAVTDIIGSSCVSIDAVGRPRTFCDLARRPEPLSLIDSVPLGTELVFQLRALSLVDANGGCDNEVDEPIRIFSGISDPILIDGKDHLAVLHLSTCGSCSDLPSSPPDGGSQDASASSDLGATFDLASPSDAAVADAGTPPDLAPPDLSPRDLSTAVCPPGQVESPYYPYGARCCPVLPPSACPVPGSRCPDGTTALLPPGGCCAVCD